jgi:hypothetical protein
VKKVIILALIFLGENCNSSNQRTVQEAFRFMASAIESKKEELLYDALDTKSKWSLISIHRTEKRIFHLMKQYYPSQEKEKKEFRRHQLIAGLKDARSFFALRCKVKGCLKKLMKGLAPIKRIRYLDKRQAEVITVRGGRYLFCRGPKRRWGLCLFFDELEEAKKKAALNLETVQKNVQAYTR